MPNVLSRPQVLKKMKKTETTWSQAARPPLGGGGPAFHAAVVVGGGCCFSASGATELVAPSVRGGAAVTCGEDFSEEAREGEEMPVAVDWSERFPSASVVGPWVVRSGKVVGAIFFAVAKMHARASVLVS